MQSRAQRRMAIRDLFQTRMLREIARRALASPDDATFARFHKDTIEALFAGMTIDFLAVSTVKVDHRLQPVGGVDCVPLGLHPSIVDNYANVASIDVIAPAIYTNPGRLVAHSTILREEAWQEHPFYRDHCRIYDIRRALMLGFLYPGHDRKFITIEYLGSPDNRSWIRLDHRQFEMATFPFALAWLCRKGAVDDAGLARLYRAFADLTESELTMLRKYVNSPHQDLSEQAADIGGASTASYKSSLYELRDKLAERFDWERVGAPERRRKSLRPLDADFAFLRMLGDPAAKLILPHRQPPASDVHPNDREAPHSEGDYQLRRRTTF